MQSNYPKIKLTSLQSRGFTLLEILIALAIFAVVAVITAVGLRAVIRTYQHLKQADARLQQVVMAVTIMRRDITQLIERPVENTSGVLIPALWIPSRTEIEFTRAGYTNPMQLERRSTLQRVAYQYKNHKLYRITWPVLDRAPHTPSQRKLLLNHIQHFKMTYINEQGQLVQVWSTAMDATNVYYGADHQPVHVTFRPQINQPFPHAIIINLQLAHLGHMRLVFPIRARG